MAATSTVTYDDGRDRYGESGGFRVLIEWQSAADGTCTISVDKVCGRLVKAVTDPGDSAPTDNYDIAITDDEGVNVLSACQADLTNRDTTTSEQQYFMIVDAAVSPLAQSLHPLVCSTLTVSITNGGDTKTGQIILYFRR